MTRSLNKVNMRVSKALMLTTRNLVAGKVSARSWGQMAPGSRVRSLEGGSQFLMTHGEFLNSVFFWKKDFLFPQIPAQNLFRLERAFGKICMSRKKALYFVLLNDDDQYPPHHTVLSYYHLSYSIRQYTVLGSRQ